MQLLSILLAISIISSAQPAFAMQRAIPSTLPTFISYTRPTRTVPPSSQTGHVRIMQDTGSPPPVPIPSNPHNPNNFLSSVPNRKSSTSLFATQTGTSNGITEPTSPILNPEKSQDGDGDADQEKDYGQTVGSTVAAVVGVLALVAVGVWWSVWRRRKRVVRGRRLEDERAERAGVEGAETDVNVKGGGRDGSEMRVLVGRESEY